MDAGEKAAEDYANSLTHRDYVCRAPDSFDPRTTFKTPAKNQGDTQLCGKLYQPRCQTKAKLKQLKCHSRLQLWLRWHSIYPFLSISYQFLLCQASIMTKFNRKTAMELSPLWLAMCKAGQTSLQESKPKYSTTYLYPNDILPLPRK
jgi:hypothetical protein